MLEAQLASLRVQEQEHLADLLAVRGAIQFCESLITKFVPPPVTQEEQPNQSGKVVTLPSPKEK